MAYPDWLSFEDYEKSVHNLVDLYFWYLNNHLKKSQEPLVKALRSRVDLGHRSPIARDHGTPDWEHHSWQTLEKELTHLFLRGNPGEFENKGRQSAKDFIQPKLREDWQSSPGGDWPFGCLALEEPGTWDPDPQTVFFHVGNPLAPRSILSQPGYLEESLKQAALWARKNWGPDLIFTTETWLNSHPRFLAAFPPLWTENLQTPNQEIAWHLGFWGQFQTAQGTFHEKNAENFRKTGILPFSVRRSSLSSNLFMT